MPRRSLLAAMIALLVLASVSRADPPATQPAYSLGKMRVEQLKACKVVYDSIQTTYGEMGAAIPKSVDKIVSAMKTAGVMPIGPAVLVYKGASDDPSKPFTLEVALPVDDKAAEVPGVKQRTLESLNSATFLYSGPVMQMGEVFQDIFDQVFASGNVPAGDLRERYLYWEGPDSPNNVVLIEIPIKPNK